MVYPDSLVPHAVCWAGSPKLIWTMVVANAITFLSYFGICLTLLLLAKRTGRVIARDWAYFLIGFALFIVACGLTHLMEIVTTWIPVFWMAAWINVVTAGLSAYVAVNLMLRTSKIAFGINDYADRLANIEQESQQMRESLIAAQKIEEWSRISTVVSHEIRGPLDAIQNLQYLILSTEGIPSDIAEYARTSVEEAKRALLISNSTLSFFRQGKKPELIDICGALDTVRLLLDSVIREKRIDFQTEVEGDCIVEAYAGETRQVLLNIVRNACEAVPPTGATITVTLKGEPSGVIITVADQGPGIAPEILSTLFQFGATTKGDLGNGIGLWTVKHIIDKHGGEVKVHSTPGSGTRFNLMWPRSAPLHL